MDEYLKQIFDLYLNDEIYSNQITHDKQFMALLEEIHNLQEKIIKSLKCNSKDSNMDLLVQNLFNTHMELSNLYRYYDFVEGFALGTLNGINCTKHDDKTVYKINKMTKDLILKNKNID